MQANISTYEQVLVKCGLNEIDKAKQLLKDKGYTVVEVFQIDPTTWSVKGRTQTSAPSAFVEVCDKCRELEGCECPKHW